MFVKIHHHVLITFNVTVKLCKFKTYGAHGVLQLQSHY